MAVPGTAGGSCSCASRADVCQHCGHDGTVDWAKVSGEAVISVTVEDLLQPAGQRHETGVGTEFLEILADKCRQAGLVPDRRGYYRAEQAAERHRSPQIFGDRYLPVEGVECSADHRGVRDILLSEYRGVPLPGTDLPERCDQRSRVLLVEVKVLV